MTQKRTEKNKYKRITTEGYCTFEDYIAEWLIIRWTDQFKMDKPPCEFWKIPGKYEEMYQRNMKAAKSLHKKYDPLVICAAIKSEHFNKIYHIGLKCYGPRGWKYNPLAIEAIKRYDKEYKQLLKVAEQKDKPVEQKETKPLQSRKQKYSNKKTSINKLRDL
jgi:hypothetical protein